MFGIEFADGRPAAFIKKTKIVVVGDLHIGLELKLAKNGMYAPNAAELMAQELLEFANSMHAKSIVILGDVKDEIGYAERKELEGIRTFFNIVNKEFDDITIAKGNHDGHIEEILKMVGARAKVMKEVLVGNFALLHGNALPSKDALAKRYIIEAHGHMAANMLGKIEKVWVVANAKAHACSGCGKGTRLIVIPAFNRLITGSIISESNKNYLPLFRRGMFDYENAKVYSLDGSLIGRVREIER